MSLIDKTIEELLEEGRKVRPTDLRYTAEMRTGERVTMAKVWEVIQRLETQKLATVEKKGHGFWIHHGVVAIPPKRTGILRKWKTVPVSLEGVTEKEKSELFKRR